MCHKMRNYGTVFAMDGDTKDDGCINNRSSMHIVCFDARSSEAVVELLFQSF